jgi:hypothetical protein
MVGDLGVTLRRVQPEVPDDRNHHCDDDRDNEFAHSAILPKDRFALNVTTTGGGIK